MFTTYERKMCYGVHRKENMSHFFFFQITSLHGDKETDPARTDCTECCTTSNDRLTRMNLSKNLDIWLFRIRFNTTNYMLM